MIELVILAYIGLLVFVWWYPQYRYRQWRVRNDAAHARRRAWWAEREAVVGRWHESAAAPLDVVRYRQATEEAREWLATHPEPRSGAD